GGAAARINGRRSDPDDPRASDVCRGGWRGGTRRAWGGDSYLRAEMSTDVVMPQMGESIAEGTIVRWIKKVGDQVDRDEPLFEISTDKVDAEIPSPAAGVVSEIRVHEGETVPVNSVVAVIGGAVQRAEPRAPAPEPIEPPKPS